MNGQAMLGLLHTDLTLVLDIQANALASLPHTDTSGSSLCGQPGPRGQAEIMASEHTLSCPNLTCKARADCVIISFWPEYPLDLSRSCTCLKPIVSHWGKDVPGVAEQDEEPFMSRSCLVLVLVMLSTVFVAADSRTGEVQRLGGRVLLKINSAVPPGGGFDFTWGKGTLTLIDGTTQAFSISGLGIQGNEGSLFDLEAK